MSRKLACQFVIGVGPAIAQKVAHDLTEATLEDLMNIEIASVSKKSQKSVTAAAVFAIAQEHICRSGMGSIPELLRMVPGLDVAQIDASTWAISSRGFNAQSGTKMLVLFDRRVVYRADDSGVPWDEQDTLLSDIDRIEVVRGPGATLCGANAVNGVINIITKSSKDTQDGLAAVRSGNEDHTLDKFHCGGKAGESVTYRNYTKYSSRADYVRHGETEPNVDWSEEPGSFRADWPLSNRDTPSVQGGGYRGRSGFKSGLGWPPRSPLEISVGGQYLQGGRYLELVPEGYTPPARAGRSFYAGMPWQF